MLMLHAPTTLFPADRLCVRCQCRRDLALEGRQWRGALLRSTGAGCRARLRRTATKIRRSHSCAAQQPTAGRQCAGTGNGALCTLRCDISGQRHRLQSRAQRCRNLDDRAVAAAGTSFPSPAERSGLHRLADRPSQSHAHQPVSRQLRAQCASAGCSRPPAVQRRSDNLSRASTFTVDARATEASAAVVAAPRSAGAA